MLNLADILELIVDRLYDGAFPEDDFVMQTHQRVLHVFLNFGYQVYIIHEELFKEVLADISSVSEEFSEQTVSKPLVFQWLAVVLIAGSECPLYNLGLVVDDQVQLQTVEPSHCGLALCCPSAHGLVRVHPLDVAYFQRRGVYDGNARALTQGTGLQEEQQLKPDLCLSLNEAVVGYGVRKVAAHMLADVAKIKGLQVTETASVEQHQDSHYLAVGQTARTVPGAFAGDAHGTFFQLRGKIFAEFVESTENFY